MKRKATFPHPVRVCSHHDKWSLWEAWQTISSRVVVYDKIFWKPKIFQVKTAGGCANPTTANYQMFDLRFWKVEKGVGYPFCLLKEMQEGWECLRTKFWKYHCTLFWRDCLESHCGWLGRFGDKRAKGTWIENEKWMQSQVKYTNK